MASVVKCEHCGSRFRPGPLVTEESVGDKPDSDRDRRCPRCDTLYVPPEEAPRNWRLYGVVGVAAGFLVAGGMLLTSWLGSAASPDGQPDSTGGRQLVGPVQLGSNAKVADEDRPEPVLPGAIAGVPEWLDTAGPFNPHDLFHTPEPKRNAAPLYLDALFGFSSELAVCVPEDLREPRLSKSRARSQEFVALFRQWQTDPQSVDVAALDLCLAGYNECFEDLTKAQMRPRCVFVSDLNLFAEQRHVNAAREAANVASLRIQLTLRDGRPIVRKIGSDDSTDEQLPGIVERSLADVEQILRLSRDLRTRGRIETQLASLAIDQTMLGLLPQLVAQAELTVADCDRITRLLTRHKAETMNPYVEGLRSEYLLLRALLEDLRAGRGLLPESQVAREADDALGADRPKVPIADSVSPGYLLASRSRVKDVSSRALEIDLKLAAFTDADFESERDTMDAVWTELFQVSGGNAGLRRAAAFSAEEKLRTDTILLGSLSKLTELADVTTWWEATLNSLHCVVAVRRWELEHTEPPQDLLTAVRQSGMPFVPVDPYGGGPLRMSSLDDEAIIYSVGPDTVDDQGRKVTTSTDPNELGDIVFRIPYLAANPNGTVKGTPGSNSAGF
jgi:hypothetical protein